MIHYLAITDHWICYLVIPIYYLCRIRSDVEISCVVCGFIVVLHVHFIGVGRNIPISDVSWLREFRQAVFYILYLPFKTRFRHLMTKHRVAVCLPCMLSDWRVQYLVTNYNPNIH